MDEKTVERGTNIVMNWEHLLSVLRMSELIDYNERYTSIKKIDWHNTSTYIVQPFNINHIWSMLLHNILYCGLWGKSHEEILQNHGSKNYQYHNF